MQNILPSPTWTFMNVNQAAKTGHSEIILPFKSLELVIFLKQVSYAHQGCHYLIKNSNILKYDYNFKTTVFYFNTF